MVVYLKTGKNRDVITTSLSKIGIIAKTSLSPQPDEEWEVSILRDTCPGERKGVLILNPIRRIEVEKIDAEIASNGTGTHPVLIRKSGNRVIEKTLLDRKYIRSIARSNNQIQHEFEPVFPEGVQIPRPWSGWGLFEIEFPEFPEMTIVEIQRQLVSAWRNGQVEINCQIPYRHKYGGTIILDFKGYQSPRDDLAILKDGYAYWPEIVGISFGHENETTFMGSVKLIPHECGGAENSAQWIEWAESIYCDILGRLSQYSQQWIETTVEAEKVRLEKSLTKLKDYKTIIAKTYGDDVVPRRLGDIERYRSE